jgi:hypothetical protein
MMIIYNIVNSLQLKLLSSVIPNCFFGGNSQGTGQAVSPSQVWMPHLFLCDYEYWKFLKKKGVHQHFASGFYSLWLFYNWGDL